MDKTITNSEFYILLSLAIKSRHGYEIMKQVESDSESKVRLGPGTLYGSIKRMLASDLIVESDHENPRRKYYSITEKGRSALTTELDRYESSIRLAKQAKLMNDFRPIWAD